MSYMKHGMHGTREYRSWQNMKARCLKTGHHKFPLYGGRGIAVTERWLGEHGFENFLADMGERPVGTTLNRIDNDGNYCKENCNWATPLQQTHNRRPLSQEARLKMSAGSRNQWAKRRLLAA